MGLLGDFSKGFLIMVGVYCVFTIIGFVVSGMTEIGLLFLFTLMIPLSVITFEYWKSKKEEKKKKAQPESR